MKTSQRIIKRLYDMGIIDNLNPIVRSYHGSRNGSWSWCISNGTRDIGSMESMKECLSWKRWVYSRDLHEIFKFNEGMTLSSDDIVEDIKE